MKYKVDVYTSFEQSDDEYLGLITWLDTDSEDEAIKYCETMTAKGYYCKLTGGLFDVQYYPNEREE